MAFLAKILLLSGFTVGLSALWNSETVWATYYGSCGTHSQTRAYVRELTLRHMHEQGCDARSIEFARRHP